MKPGELVRVEWLDATGPTDLWPDDDLDIAITWTMGRVRSVDKRKIVIAAEWFAEEGAQERACTAIPQVCIVGVERLEPVQ